MHIPGRWRRRTEGVHDKTVPSDWTEYIYIHRPTPTMFSFSRTKATMFSRSHLLNGDSGFLVRVHLHCLLLAWFPTFWPWVGGWGRHPWRRSSENYSGKAVTHAGGGGCRRQHSLIEPGTSLQIVHRDLIIRFRCDSEVVHVFFDSQRPRVLISVSSDRSQTGLFIRCSCVHLSAQIRVRVKLRFFRGPGFSVRRGLRGFVVVSSWEISNSEFRTHDGVGHGSGGPGPPIHTFLTL